MSGTVVFGFSFSNWCRDFLSQCTTLYGCVFGAYITNRNIRPLSLIIDFLEVFHIAVVFYHSLHLFCCFGHCFRFRYVSLVERCPNRFGSILCDVVEAYRHFHESFRIYALAEWYDFLIHYDFSPRSLPVDWNIHQADQFLASVTDSKQPKVQSHRIFGSSGGHRNVARGLVRACEAVVAATLFDSVQSDRNNLVIEIGCPSLLVDSSDTAWVYVAVIAAADKCDVNVGR